MVLLEHLGTVRPCPLERGIHIVRREDQKGQHALRQELLERVAVGLRPPGVRLGQDDLGPGSDRVPERHPAKPARLDVIENIETERIAVKRHRLIHVIDRDVAVL
jgi:hypothetical protein